MGKFLLNKISRDLARLVVRPHLCRFPGTNIEEQQQFFCEVRPLLLPPHRQLLLLILHPAHCFLRLTFHDVFLRFLQNIAPVQKLNAAAVAEFIQLTKEDPSRNWDRAALLALCHHASSFQDETADFLVQIDQLIKNPDSLESDDADADEALKAGLFGELGGLLGGLADLAGLVGGQTGGKKVKSQYQFK
jgi:hypothetical protein